MLLVIDNYDSFTFNLVQYFGQLGVEQRVFRNNEITPSQALAMKPDRVLLSPGPCSPREAGVTLDIIKAFAGVKPMLGVCLGHQSIGHYFGGKVIRASRLMHGKRHQSNTATPTFFAECLKDSRRRAITHCWWNAARFPQNLRSRQKRRKAKSWVCAIARSRFGACSFILSRSPPKAG